MPIFRERRLPHLHAIGQPMFVTWRLHGSLPAGRRFRESTTSGYAFVAMDRILDSARTGPLYLRLPDIAHLVVAAIRYREDRGEYDLHNYVVMANHVHLLVTPHIELSRLMQSWKRYTARKANKILRLTGQPFRQDESYDRLVRGPEEFRKIASYIEMNPVRAGLAASPWEFPWSSAKADCQSAAGCHPAPHPHAP
jgi:putative transposase